MCVCVKRSKVKCQVLLLRSGKLYHVAIALLKNSKRYVDWSDLDRLLWLAVFATSVFCIVIMSYVTCVVCMAYVMTLEIYASCFLWYKGVASWNTASLSFTLHTLHVTTSLCMHLSSCCKYITRYTQMFCIKMGKGWLSGLFNTAVFNL